MRYKIHASIMSLCAAFAMTAYETPAAQSRAYASATNPQSATKIVFLGDSLTAGFGLPQQQAWPQQVQKRLTSAGYNTIIINAGVSGDNSANGLARYDRSVGSVQADMLVLALGANDFLQGVSPVRTRANLTKIIERAQADGLEVVLAGVSTPQLARLGPIGRAYGSIYPDLARTYNLAHYPSIIDGVANKRGLVQRDGIHPTKRGVEVMADNFAPYLSEILDK